MQRTRFKNSFKGKVLADARRQIEEYKKSGAWLHKSVLFDTDRYLDEKNKVLANRLLSSLKTEGGYKAEQKQKDMEILLANLLDQTRKPIRISLNIKDYTRTRYNKCSYFTVELIHLLYKRDYLKMEKGYNIEKDSRMTRIWATEKLLHYFPEYATCVFSKPNELVILRDEKGKPKEYKDTAETWRIRGILERVNDVNDKADIRCQNHKLYASLRAIFLERFTWYGRLHTKGFRHYQGFDESERGEITINGDPIVELDYSGLHPNLLYATAGIQYSGDPYSVVDNRSECRPFLKQILLCMLNAKDEISAERASNYWLHKNPGEREKLNEINITRARPFIDKFLEVHQPIAHYFCKGKNIGLRIMNKDSKIALDIVNYFTKQGIPILCIHDSFIVQKQYRKELFQVMKNMYYKHTGFDIKIK